MYMHLDVWFIKYLWESRLFSGKIWNLLRELFIKEIILTQLAVKFQFKQLILLIAA